jgi:hypothetical protein
MYKCSLCTLLGAVLFLVFSSFTQNSSAQDKQRILIQIPLSGGLASAGHALKSGFDLAIKDSKKESQIEFIYDDSEYSAKKALSSLKSHYSQNKPDFLITFGAPTTLAVKSFVEQNNLPTLSLSAASQLDTATAGIIKRVWESADSLGILIAAEIAKRGYKKIAIVTTENDATIAILESVNKHLKQDAVLSEMVALSETDFRSVATKVRAAGIDCVVSNLLAGQHMLLISRLQEQTQNMPVISQSAIFFDPKMRDPYPKNLEGLSIATVDDGSAYKLYQRFNPDSQAQNSVFMAALGYDLLSMVLKTIDSGWDFKSPLPLSGFAGVVGSYKHRNENSLEPPIAMFRIENGELRKIN